VKSAFRQERAVASNRLELLGGFRLTGPDGHSIGVPARKNRALLGILALSPKVETTRDRLAGLLWSDRGEEQARSSLRQALVALRNHAPRADGELLLFTGDRVALNPAVLISDVTEFLDCATNGDVGGLRRAASLYAGAFLDGLTVADNAFEEWLREARSDLAARATVVLETLTANLTGPDRIAFGQKLVALDPLREASHRALIEAYLAEGEKGLARKQFEACKLVLKRELRVEPAAETMELERLMADAGMHLASIREPAGSRSIPAAPVVGRGDRSIAVLPFTNLSSDVEQQYFADGITEDLITDLSKVPGLFVIAAQTSFRFRGEPDPAVMGRELGVRYVVQGSVRRVSGNLRLNAHLVEVTSSAVLWADRFDRDIEGIYLVQSELAARIAEKIAGPEYQMPPERYRPASLEAYELVMPGRKEWRHSDDAGTRAAPLFERAIKLDPGYSEAYRWLAHGHFMSWLFYNGPIGSARSQALINARKAAACDPGDAAAHAILAVILNYDREWDAAAAELELALRLNPNDSETWSILSDLRVLEGRGREAVHCAERALECNPRPLGYFYWLLGQAHIAAGNPEAAVNTLRREETYRTVSRRQLAAALAMLGRLGEAREEGRLFMAAYPHFTIRHWIETQPFRDLTMRDRFIEAYRKAGLPE
jgi:TolB-like protein